MQLWSSEIEAMRVEARAVVAASMPGLRDFLGVDGGVSAEPLARAHELRARFEMLDAPVPEAVSQRLAGVRCRVLRPDSPARAVYLHFHGGGMVVGTPEMSDVSNRDLSRRCSIAVVSVDYRLAPEHPYPAAPDDGVAVAAGYGCSGASR